MGNGQGGPRKTQENLCAAEEKVVNLRISFDMEFHTLPAFVDCEGRFFEIFPPGRLAGNRSSNTTMFREMIQ